MTAYSSSFRGDERRVRVRVQSARWREAKQVLITSPPDSRLRHSSLSLSSPSSMLYPPLFPFYRWPSLTDIRLFYVHSSPRDARASHVRLLACFGYDSSGALDESAHSLYRPDRGGGDGGGSDAPISARAPPSSPPSRPRPRPCPPRRAKRPGFAHSQGRPDVDALRLTSNTIVLGFAHRSSALYRTAKVAVLVIDRAHAERHVDTLDTAARVLWTVLHLMCVRAPAARSVQLIMEARRSTRASLERQACPGCHASGRLSASYACFCAAALNATSTRLAMRPKYAIPYARRRLYRHPCSPLCHPGPSSPYHCGAHVPTSRCAHLSYGDCEVQTLSWGDGCDCRLACGHHACRKDRPNPAGSRLSRAPMEKRGASSAAIRAHRATGAIGATDSVAHLPERRRHVALRRRAGVRARRPSAPRSRQARAGVPHISFEHCKSGASVHPFFFFAILLFTNTRHSLRACIGWSYSASTVCRSSATST
jgi:hypothetical protein